MALKLAERCAVLCDVADGLLLRSYIARTQRLSDLLDNHQFSRMKARLEKAFPDVPDCSKTSGFDILVSNAQDVYDQTLPFYELLCDVTEFVQQCNMTINSMPALTLEFKLDRAHAPMCKFMHLIANYLRLHLIMSQIEERKALVSLHVFAFQVTKSKAEPNLSAVAGTILRFDKPMQTVPEELRGISEAVGNIILEFRESMQTAFDCDKLRQRNAINPLNEGLNMVLPTLTSLSPRASSTLLHAELSLVDQYAEWTIYGLLCCPTELIRPEILQLLHTIGKGLLVIPLYGDIAFDIHLALDSLAKNFPPKGIPIAVPKGLKMKNEVKDLAKKATESCGEIRREHRSFLMGEISTLVDLFKDIPGLIAPKFPMVEAALSMSKAEIRLYFLHLQADIPKSRIKLYKVEDYLDTQISQLIGFHMQLEELVRLHSEMIQQYYKEYVQTAHRLALTDIIGKMKGIARSGVQEIFDSLPVQLDPGKPCDLQVFRLDWARAQSVLLSPESLHLIKTPAVIELLHRMRRIITHSRYADSIEQFLAESASLNCLFYFQGKLMAIYKECLEANDDRPRFIPAFFRILSTVADGVHPSCPDEQMARGSAAALMAQEMIEILGKHSFVLLRNLFERLKELGNQVKPVEAAYRVERLERTQGRSEPYAGYESKPENAASIKSLTELQTSAVNLYSAIGNTGEVIVFDRLFRPKELAKERILSFAKETYRNTCTGNGEILTPSELKRTFSLTIHCIQLAASYIEIDTGLILRRVLYDEATSFLEYPYTPGTSLESMTTGKHQDSHGVTQHYAQWYRRLCESAVPGGRRSEVVFSHVKRGFIGNGIENFTDTAEFRVLYSMIGGYGMAVIESGLVRLIMTKAERIKAFLVENSSALHNFKQKHEDPDSWESVCQTVTRDMKDLDEFLIDSIALGNAVALRRVIAEAVHESQKALVPFTESSVSMAIMATTHDGYENASGLAMLAQESCGIIDPFGGFDIDQSVRSAIASLGATTQDIQAIWSFLPFAFAASYAARPWKNARFDPELDVIKGNLHMSTLAMSQLLRCFNIDGAARYIKASSFFILRMKSTETFRDWPLRATCILLDKFVQETGIVGRSTLDQNIPYAILHSSFVDVSAIGLK